MRRQSQKKILLKELESMSKAATQPGKNSIYGVHPGVAMTQKWIGELKQKTGHSLDEWLRLIKKWYQSELLQSRFRVA